MESLENLNDPFVHELRDLYDAEQQLAKALPLLATAATSDQLRQAFQEHLEETKEQARRLEQIFKGLGEPAEGKSCKAMSGLGAETRETLDVDADPEVLDAALTVAAQRSSIMRSLATAACARSRASSITATPRDCLRQH